MRNFFQISEAASLAIHAVALLASGNGRRSVHSMAGLLGASEHHLAKVMNRLVRAGLVRSSRGPRGGFSLARSSASISLADVLRAVEPPAAGPACLLPEQVCRGRRCVLGNLIERMNRDTNEWLEHTMLSELKLPIGKEPTDENREVRR